MKKRFGLILIILIAVVVAGIVWLALPEPEPIYQGKRLSSWLTEYAESPDGGTSEKQAWEAIRAIGTNALPLLVKWVGAKDSFLRAKSIALLREQTLIRVPCYTDEDRRIIARVGFGALGSTAAPAVPTLIDLLNNDSNRDIQAEVVMSLERIGPAAQDAVPAIIKCMDGTNHFAALFAPTTLASIHRRPDLVVPALIHHLEEFRHNPIHVPRTVEAIGSFGGQATNAVPVLLTFLNDPDASTRSLATNALRQIDPEAAAKAGIK